MLCWHRLVIAANGVAYLPYEARPGIVPRLLQEILSTRIMVKGAMKSTPASHKVLQVSTSLPPTFHPHSHLLSLLPSAGSGFERVFVGVSKILQRWFLSSLGTMDLACKCSGACVAACDECAAVWAEADCECDVWLHLCWLLRQDAHGRNR